MITLIATVLETGFTSVSTLAAEITTDDGIVVNTDAVEESSQEEASEPAEYEESSGDDLDIEVVPDESADADTSEYSSSDGYEEDSLVRSEGSEEGYSVTEGAVEDAAAEESAVEEETFEEADALKEGNLEMSDDEIRGSGYDEISIYVDTEKLAKKDRFRIEFTGPADASYNPVINEDLDKTNDGRYDFEYLDGGEFSIRITSSDDVILSCKYNEDGYPTFALESVRAEKSLDTETIIASDNTEAAAIKGEGYDSITIKFATEDLSDKAAFKLYVETDAEATVDGEDATRGITGLDKNTGSLTVEDLDGESFVAYVISDNDEVKIKTLADVDSVEDGVAVITVDNENVKRDYKFEDAKIKVTATLEKADAVPDDAYFDVTPLTEEEAAKYLEALNADKDVENGDVLATADNTLLYNIGFYTDESKSEEIEPEEGSVSISIEFKKEQLSEELGAEAPEDLVVTHIKEEGSDITTEEVDASALVEEGVIEFDTDSLSVWAISKITDSGTITTTDTAADFSFATSLGKGYDYGIIANTYTHRGDTETNVMVGSYSSSVKDVGASNNYSNAGGNNYFGDIEGPSNIEFHQAPANVYLGDAATAKYNNGTVTFSNVDKKNIHKNHNIAVDSVISGIGTYYSNYFDMGTTIKKTQTGSQRFPTVDLRKQPDGVYVIKSDSTFMDKDSDGLDIYLNPGQRLIINCTATDLTLQRWHLNGKQPSEYIGSTNREADWATTAVIFNMQNATSVKLTESMGVIIAPNAKVTCDGGACGGILVCNSNDAGNEWHYHNHDLPSPDGTGITLYARKTVDGQPANASNGERFEFKLFKAKKEGNGSNAKILMDGSEDSARLDTQYNDNSGSVSFDIEYPVGSNAGDYYYIIKETGGAEGFTYDSTVYAVKVPVTIDSTGNVSVNESEKKIIKINDDGSASGSFLDGEVSNAIDTPVVFNNTPIGEEEEEPGTYKIKVKKYLKDSKGKELTDLKYWPAKFYFKAEPYNNDPTPVDVKLMPQLNPGQGWIEYNTNNHELELGTVKIDNPKELYNFVYTNYYEPNKGLPNNGYGNSIKHFSGYKDLGWGSYSRVLYLNFKWKISETIDTANTKIIYDQAGMQEEINGVKTTSHFLKIWVNLEDRYDARTRKHTYTAYLDPKYSWNNSACDGELVGPLVFNNYYDVDGETQVYGFKEFDNKTRKPKDKEFTFNLKDASGKVVGTAKNDSNGNFTISPKLKYTLADLGGERYKTFTYTLEEATPTDSNISCLTGPKTVTVTVTDNNGTNSHAKADLGLTVTNDFDNTSDRALFINSYGATGKVQFWAEKDEENTSPELKDKEFAFVLKEGEKVLQTIPDVKVGHPRAFEEITYDKSKPGDVGTHEYTITEAKKGQTENGITYSDQTYYIKVVVEDNGTKDLKKTVYAGYNKDKLDPINGNAMAKAVLANTYNADKCEYDIDGSKTLIGKQLDKDEFSFTLAFDSFVNTQKQSFTEASDDFVKMPANKTVTNDASGSFKFDKITFKKAGTYTFTVVEEAKTEESESTEGEGQTQEKKYIPDGTTYTVTFEIVDGGNGKLVLAQNGKTIKKNGSDAPEGIEFINRYVNKTSIPLYAIKNFDTIASRPIRNDEFKFNLVSEDGLDTVNVPQNEVGNVGTLASFRTLNYNTNMLKDSEGKLLPSKDFKYRITEVIPWGDTSKFAADAVANKTVPTKSVGGRTYYVAKDGILYDVNAEEGYVVTVHVERKNIDTPQETIEPTVLDDTHADSNSADENTVKFYNRYEASGSFDVPLVKTMVGRKFDKDDVFTFGLFAPGDDEDKPTRKIVVKGSDFLDSFSTPGGDNILKFGEITIDQDNMPTGPVDYIVKEMSCVTASGKEVEVSPDRYIVRLTCRDDGFGHIECSTTTYKNGVSETNKVSNAVCAFENHYNAEGSDFFEIEKRFNGDIQRGQFTFFLTDPSGKTVERTNGHGQKNEDIDNLYKVIFDDVTFDRDTVLKNKNGTYEPYVTLHYTMGEVETGSNDRISYNTENALYDIAVTITDNGSGVLGVEKTYTKLDKDTGKAHAIPLGQNEIPYINNYYEAEGDEEIFATKILEGREFKVGEDGRFKFKLTPEVGESITLPVTADKAGNTAKAKFNFHFTKDDLDGNTAVSGSHKSTEPDSNGVYEYTKYYTLEEVIPTDATKIVSDENGILYTVYVKDGYIYDTTKYTVEITLKDNGKGTIETSWKAYPKDTQPAERGFFAKLWQKIVATLNLEAIGIENADHRAVFVNKYESTAALKLKVTKNLVGEGWTKNDGDFSFTLTGQREKGKDVETYTDTQSITLKRDEGGNIAEPREYEDVEFDIVTFTRASKNEYVYTIKEDTVKDGFVCEYPEHTVKVKVEENENANGKLVVYASIDGGPMEPCSVDASADAKDANGNPIELYVPTPVIITNEYGVKPIKVKFGGDKTLTGRPVEKADTFTFDVAETDADGNVLSGGYSDSKTVTAALDGDKYVLPAFEFNEIGYSIEDLKVSEGNYAADKTFYYTVSERPGTIKNVEYDSNQYKVVVKVTNLKNGKLQADVVSSDLDGVSVLSADEFKITSDNITTTDGIENVPVAKVAKFDNKYIVPGKLPLEVKKVVEGSTAAGLKFNFTLTGDVKKDLTAKVVTGQNDNKASFADITYDYDEIKAAGGTKTYHYTVTEDLPKDEQGNEIDKKDGITYTRDKYEITVVVTAPTDLTKPLDIKETVSKYLYTNNGYSVDPDYNEKEGIYLFSFTNEYDAEGGTPIEGFKVVPGSDDRRVLEGFKFKITRTNADGEIIPFEDGEVSQTEVTSGADGIFHFDMHYTLASYNEEPERYYKITEDCDEETRKALNAKYQEIYGPGAELDFDKDKDGKIVKVVLSDSGNGTINADISDNELPVTIENPLYLPNSIRFVAEKTLTGRPLKGDWFKFTLKKTGDNGYEVNSIDNKEEVTVVVREDGQTADITFPAETFTLNDAGKTYHYEIIEEDYSKIKGVKRIVTSYKAEVKITKDPDNNRIQILTDDVRLICDGLDESYMGNVLPQVNESKPGAYTIGGIKFKNEYSSEVEIELKGEKHISGFDENPDEDFTFALYNFSDQKNPVKINDDGKVGSEGDEQKFTVNPSKDKDLTFAFKKIKYDQTDVGNTFHYVIKEVVPEKKTENVSYSTIWYDITIAVDYAGANKDGVLTATVTQKKMDGNSELSTDKYTSTYNEDKNLGTLKVAGFDFTNRYLYNSIAFAAIKDLKGRAHGKKETYSFKLTDEFNKKEYTALSDGSGQAELATIPYGEGDLDKVHEYTITETAAKDGSELDPAEAQSYRVEVTPYEDTTDGKLKLKKQFYAVYKDGSEKEYNAGADDALVFKFEFHNIYNRDGNVEVPVKKILVNKALDPAKDKFKFTLKDASGAKIRVKEGDKFVEKDQLEITNESVAAAGLARKELEIDGVTRTRRFDESDEFYFDSIWYNSIDDLGNQDEVTKYYIVTEEVGEDSKSYIEYSKTEYVVEVTIKATDDPKEKLAKITNFEASDEIKGDEAKTNSFIEWIKSLGKNQEEISKNCEFINFYSAKCEIDPPILRKAIMGREIVPGEFQFEITGPALESNPKYAGGYKNIVKNGYKTVTDAKGNTTYELIPGHPDEIFVGDIIYNINKDFDDLQYGEELTSDEKSHVGADADKYKKFVYTAKEIAGDSTDGVEYPTDLELTLTVFVMDDGEGNLKVKGLGNTEFWDKETNPKALEWKQTKGSNKVEVEVNVEENDENGNTVVTKKKVDIVNIFDQKGHIDLEGKKLYNGPDFDAGKFSFKITEVNDPVERKPVTDKINGKDQIREATVTNSGDGTIGSDPDLVKFDHNTIDFLNYNAGVEYDKDTNTYTAKPLEEVVGPHFYLIEETAQTDENIDYDYNKYIVTIDVSETYRYENGKKVYDTRNNGVPVLKAEVSNVQVLVPGSERLDTPDFTPSRTGDVETGFTYHTTFKFENKREAYGNVSISGIKFLADLAGNALASPNSMKDQFGFAIHQYDDAARTRGKTLIDSTRSEADGSFNLNVIKEGKNYAYDLNDLKDEKGVAQTSKTFYYRVTETKPSSGVWSENNTVFESEGVIYDLVEYDVDVKVTFDGTKALKIEKTIRNAATGEAVASKYTSRGKDLGFSNTVKEYTVIEGNKYWIDNFTDPNDRPTVTVNLYQRTASGVERRINSYDIVAPDTTYRFATDASGNELPTYDSAGRPYTYIVEETPIEGYLSEKINYDFYNTAGDILIRKIDADTRAPLAGATLAIMDGSTEIERWTSGASAHVVESVLTAGRTYTLHEIEAPEGYGLADDMTFTVPTDGDTITVTMSDPPIYGSVRLTKRDAATRETLAGAEFALYNEAGTRIYATGAPGSYRATSTTSNGVFVTDGSGSLTIADLPYGTYYFVETKAPDGYALSTERLGFTIVRGGELVEVTYLDSKAVGSVRLRKVGARGTIGLAGAVFELYARTPRTVGQAASSTLFSDAYYRYGTYRTNAAGEIYVGDLPWDDYYFVEVDAPAGYEVATDVNGDDLVYVFTVGAGTADLTIDLGGIVNNPTEETTPPPRGGVLGARVKKGGVVNGVLGVRAKPTSGVLGERIGPVTGDASNIILWLLLLTACVATIVVTIITGKKKKTAK